MRAFHDERVVEANEEVIANALPSAGGLEVENDEREIVRLTLEVGFLSERQQLEGHFPQILITLSTIGTIT